MEEVMVDFPERPLPESAVTIPPQAKKVFSGIIFDVYQWPQKQFDGSIKTFEMLQKLTVGKKLLLIN